MEAAIMKWLYISPNSSAPYPRQINPKIYPH